VPRRWTATHRCSGPGQARLHWGCQGYQPRVPLGTRVGAIPRWHRPNCWEYQPGSRLCPCAYSHCQLLPLHYRGRSCGDCRCHALWQDCWTVAVVSEHSKNVESIQVDPTGPTPSQPCPFHPAQLAAPSSHLQCYALVVSHTASELALAFRR
jgi:hypothetical protein